jgi:acetate---CoA ligase (ADP-forming)
MIASATAADYQRAIGILGACREIDALIVIFTPPLVTQAEDVVDAIHAAVRDMTRRIPVLSVFMSKDSSPHVVRSGDVAIPYYPFPEEAAHALALAAGYAAWRAMPDEPIATPDGIERDRATAVIASALGRGADWMAAGEVAELLGCYRIPLVETRIVASPMEAGEAADQLDVPVAVKAIAPGVLHKSDAGGVRLGLQGASAVERAARSMSDDFDAAGHPVTAFQLQPMVRPGVEMIVGVVQDEHFGPVLACGAGGTATELLKDVAVRITPITRSDAERMVRSLRTFPMLDGYRGAPKADVGALVDVLLRVSALVENHAQIAEMDLNPVVVHATGAVAVDARIRLEPATARKPLSAR